MILNCEKKKEQDKNENCKRKLESLSNKSAHSNLEIVENVEETEYLSSATSVINNIATSPQQREDTTISETETETAEVTIPCPQPMKSKRSVPISTPKPTQNNQSNNNNNNNTNAKSTKSKSKSNSKSKSKSKQKKSRASPANKPAPAPGPAPAQVPDTKSKVAAQRTGPAASMEQERKNEEAEDKYVYDARRVNFNWDFSKQRVYRHSTMIYIGNIPLHISFTGIQHFVKGKFKVNMAQIETKLLKSQNG